MLVSLAFIAELSHCGNGGYKPQTWLNDLSFEITLSGAVGSRVDAVADRHVDQAVLVTERDRRLVPQLGQRVQPGSPSSAEHNR